MTKESVGKFFTSHTNSFILSLLQVLLGQFQVKIELDLFLIQVSKPSPELARSLQSADCQSTGTEIGRFRAIKYKFRSLWENEF